MLVADDVEQGGGQDNAQDKVGERGDHEAPHHARAAEHAVGNEFCRDEEIERRDDA